ncbi:MAG: MBOAT family protein, partial [Bacteriovoracaceae bacterium]|nr:MBOAT family protein [Bacteriovoracaceae bacterium]
MLFSSIDFICVFLPVVWLAYFLIGSRSAKNSKILLIFASLFFYGYWKPIYLPIIIISVLVNFSLGRLLSVEGEQRLKKTFLIVGILLNVGLLIVFKYSDFF